MVRERLLRLPTARQSEGAQDATPTARSRRNLRTHFARFVVIDDAVFNGRDAGNALSVPLTGQARWWRSRSIS